MIIYTGNTLRQRVKPSAEVSAIIQNVLEQWQEQNKHDTADRGKTEIHNLDEILSSEPTSRDMTPPAEFFHNSDPEADPQSIPAEVTMKLFLPINTTSDSARKALENALNAYSKLKHTKTVYNIILSIQGVSFADESEDDSFVKDDCLFDIWKQLTSSDGATVVGNYGISELSTTRLEALVKRTKESPETVAMPTIDHINAVDCCALPPKLIALSKERGIKLLAHHDPQDLLPKADLQKIGIQGDWDWMMRLTYIVKDRQVLSGNEYLISIDESL